MCSLKFQSGLFLEPVQEAGDPGEARRIARATACGPVRDNANLDVVIDQRSTRVSFTWSHAANSRKAQLGVFDGGEDISALEVSHHRAVDLEENWRGVGVSGSSTPSTHSGVNT